MSIAAESSDTAPPPEVAAIKEEPVVQPRVPQKPTRLVFGVHDVHGRALPAERRDPVTSQQMGLFGGKNSLTMVLRYWYDDGASP